MSQQRDSQLRAGVILNYINIGLGSLIPLFYTPIMIRLLGQSEYGLYKLSASLTSYLSLAAMGMGAAVTRYIIKSREEEGIEGEERTFGTFLTIFRIIAMVAAVAAVILIACVKNWYGASLTAPEVSKMRIIMGILAMNTVLTFILSPYVSVVTANERFVFMQTMNIISTCLIPAVNLVVLFLGYASIGLAVTSLVIQFLIRIMYLQYSKRALHLTPRYVRPAPGKLKEVILFAIWIFVAELVDKLYGVTDAALIGAVPDLGTDGVAIYHVGTVFSGIVLTIAVGISGLLAPRTNRMVFQGATPAQLTDFGIQIGRIQALIITLIISGFIAFGRPFLYFYVGEAYYESYSVALLIMIPYMIPIVQNVFLNIVIAKNRHRFRSLAYLGVAILNVVGTWILIRKIGVTGAALMSGLALVLGQGFIMNWFYSKKIGLEIGRFWKSVLPIYIFPMMMAFATLYIGRWIDFRHFWPLVLGIMVFTAVYVLFNWFFIMQEGERALVRDMIHFRFK